jgi:hypothetical protein
MRMLRSDWQTKVTAHAQHPPFDHQTLSMGIRRDFRSALRHRAREDHERRIPIDSHPKDSARQDAGEELTVIQRAM